MKPLPTEFIPRSLIVMTREHLGDLVCTTPALRSLRRLYPNAHLAVEVGERAACILENNPHVDEIIIRPDHQGLRGKARFIRLLRKRKFDLGVVLDDCADPPLYLWLGGIPHRAGLVRKKRFAKLFTVPVPYDHDAHEMVDNFRRVVAALGGDVSDAAPEVFPTTEDVRKVDALFAEHGIGAKETLIALNPGASAPSNRWLPERFAELGNLLAARQDIRLLLLGSSQDSDLAEEICRQMHTAPVVLTGKLTVLQLAETLRRCAVLVTGDTGPMHLGCAMRTPIVAIFGPALPHESGPGYVAGNLVIRNVSGCPNCTKYVCSENQACMRAVTAEEVTAAVEKQLEVHGHHLCEEVML